MSLTLKIYQYPVRLTFAMTINKAQGQSFGKVIPFVKKRYSPMDSKDIYITI